MGLAPSGEGPARFFSVGDFGGNSALKYKENKRKKQVFGMGGCESRSTTRTGKVMAYREDRLCKGAPRGGTQALNRALTP